MLNFFSNIRILNIFFGIKIVEPSGVRLNYFGEDLEITTLKK
jgi:hypothetical protein